MSITILRRSIQVTGFSGEAPGPDGFVGELLVRIRMNQEEILYHHRLSLWERARSMAGEP